MLTIEKMKVRMIERIILHVEDKNAIQKIMAEWNKRGLYPIDNILNAYNELNHDLMSINFQHKASSLNELKILRDIYNGN